MFVCSECGRVTNDPDAEFCVFCGSEKGTKTAETNIPEGFQPISNNMGGVVYADAAKLRKIPFALMLALIPGFLDIYGLGHLFIGKWLRGAVFLAASGGIYYTRYAFGGYRWTLSPSGWEVSLDMVLLILSLVVFVIQLFDLFKCFKETMNESIR